MRIALGLQYDGSSYSGWQTQPSGNTIQDDLEKAIVAFIGDQGTQAQPIATITAGRTDRGVHALGQVVHFVLRWSAIHFLGLEELILSYQKRL